MEKLSLCSKVLYDHDMVEKQKYIVKLEKELKEYSPDKKVFANEKEWLDSLDEMKDRIRSFVCELIDDEDEYNFMEQMGITPKQGVLICNKLEAELYNLGGNVKWSENTAHLIEFGVNRAIQSLMRCGYWELIFGVSIPGDIASLIYENIETHLDFYESKGSIHSIPVYRCKSCAKMTSTCFDDVSGHPHCPSCAEENGLALEG